MIRHIVMWNLKNEAEGRGKEENTRLIKKGIENLMGKIDGLWKAEVGRNVNPEGGMALCLCLELRDMKALSACRMHPLQKEVQKPVYAVILDRTASDSEWETTV